MKFDRNKRNSKANFLFFILPFIIGWLGTCGGKYDNMSWNLQGFETCQFTVGSDEQIEIRLNTSGRNWTLDFDDNAEAIRVSQDGKAILEGWFVTARDFALWEGDLLNTDKYTIIKTDSEEESGFYFGLSDEGQYVFLTQIESSECSIIFFTPEDIKITQGKALDAFQRITVKTTL